MCKEFDGTSVVGLSVNVDRLSMPCPGHDPELTLTGYLRGEVTYGIETHMNVFASMNEENRNSQIGGSASNINGLGGIAVKDPCDKTAQDPQSWRSPVRRVLSGKGLNAVEEKAPNRGLFTDGRQRDGSGGPLAHSDKADGRLASRRLGCCSENSGSKIGNVSVRHLEWIIPSALGFRAAMVAVVESEDIEPFRPEMLNVCQGIPAITVQLVAVDNHTATRLGESWEQGAGEQGAVLGFKPDFLSVFDRLAPVGWQPRTSLTRFLSHIDAQNASDHVEDEANEEENKKQPDNVAHGESIAERMKISDDAARPPSFTSRCPSEVHSLGDFPHGNEITSLLSVAERSPSSDRVSTNAT